MIFYLPRSINLQGSPNYHPTPYTTLNADTSNSGEKEFYFPQKDEKAISYYVTFPPPSPSQPRWQANSTSSSPTRASPSSPTAP